MRTQAVYLSDTWRRRILVALPTCLSFALAITGFAYVNAWEQERTRFEFERRANNLFRTLQTNFNRYIESLQSINSLYASSTNVERNEFTSFVRRVLSHHSGIQALEWIPRVSDSQREAYETKAKQDGYPLFQITQRQAQGKMARATRRPEYFPVFYVEPYVGNQRALGFDLASNPARLEALVNSRDTGEPIATARITLVQETSKQFGFLTFVPIYKNGLPHDTLEQRRTNLSGFALGVFRIADMVNGSLPNLERKGIALRLYDQTAPVGERLLYADQSWLQTPETLVDQRQTPSQLEWRKTFDMAGRQWVLQGSPTAAYLAAHRPWNSWLVLAGGIVLTGLVGAFLVVVVGRTARIEEAVQQKTRFVELLSDVAVAANEVESVDDVMQFGLDRVCELTGWPVGHVYTLSTDNSEQLVPTRLWHLDDPERFETLRKVSERAHYALGAGLPGRVLATGQPVWIVDVTQNPDFRRARLVSDIGVRGAFAFPVLERNNVVAVLEFFSTESAEPDEALMQVVAQLGIQIGRAIERKQAQGTLKAREVELARSNAELEKFAYVASHDLKEPLRKIMIFGDRLVAKCEEALGTQGRDYLERMQNAAMRMQTLIDDLLAFSRVSRKTEPFVRLDLNETVRGVLSDLEAHIEQTNGQVQVDELATIDADPTQMRQLLQNLISNALKFQRPDEPPQVNVKTTILNPHNGRNEDVSNVGVRCQIVVQDNGVGFDPKHRERIFEVFQRLHGRAEYSGVGVGLAICRKIAERHGGHITANSTPGQGATFVVTLPVQHSTQG